MLSVNTPESFMRQALLEASKAVSEDEVPVGAVIVLENRIISKGHNQVEILSDATAHAELLAITSASNYLNSKYLTDCEIYVTLEPCLMCYGALKWARIKKIYFAAFDIKNGFTRTIDSQEINYIANILESEALNLMSDFFKKKRKLPK